MYVHVIVSYLLSLDISLLNAFSQAYILMTRIPEITSFMMRTRLSVTSADLLLIVKKPILAIYHSQNSVYTPQT